jgi:hypothetical protein
LVKKTEGILGVKKVFPNEKTYEKIPQIPFYKDKSSKTTLLTLVAPIRIHYNVNPSNSLCFYDQIMQFLIQLKKSISQKIIAWEFKKITVGS